MSLAAAFSTPGKAILLGEHAAVYGFPAIVATVDARMTVEARRIAGRSVRLVVPALDIRAERSWESILPLDGDDAPASRNGELAWLAVAEAARRASLALEGLEITVDSRIPVGAGFGSSAALAVAVVAAVRRALGGPDDLASIVAAALAVERRQHGRPSGVDVESVSRGGILWCARDGGGRLACRPMHPAPAALGSIRLFDSGAPRETTGEMVDAVRRNGERDASRFRGALEAIGAATAAGREALEASDVSALAPSIRQAEAALETLGVVPEGVRASIREIETDGGAAKVSGAGGLTGKGAGLVLVVHPEPAWHGRFRVPPGWTPQPAALGVAGLRTEPVR
ncbi:MAG TPA: hypothetical protein VFB67_11795 [Candidatus Polarisedimenticolaceae bacterium]|nr:hypothetical protein [Candidatus Polarisedimenticolaceae bacterium]